MINISGYGILRDSYVIDSPDNFNEMSPSSIDIYKDIPYILKAFLGNFKSKYIETSPHDAPIIQSKSISVLTKDLKSLVDSCIDEIERNRTGDVEGTLQRFVSEHYRDRVAMFDVYNCVEQDLYPIMNYELISNHGPKVNDFDRFVFYDKLVIGDNDPLKVFKSFGKLYNISPSNIPVLEKVEDIVLKDYVIKYIFNESKLNKLFTLLSCNRNDDEYNSLKIMYRVKPHFRTIDTNYINKQDVFIPTLIITINLTPINNDLMKRILNDVNNSNGEYTDYRGLFNISVSIKIISDIDFVGSKIYKYGKIVTNENLSENERRESAEKLSKFKQSFLAYDSIINSIKNKTLPNIRTWPFGNVHSDGFPCMNMSTITTGILQATSVVNNNFEIDVSQLMNGFYNDFFGSKFNMDLIITDFILKDDYIEYLKFKDSFFSDCKEENKLRAFIEYLDLLLKKGIEYKNGKLN